MDNEIIDKVIKASFDCWAEDKGSSFTVKDLVGDELEFAKRHAIAIIKAMREPTEKMIEVLKHATIANHDGELSSMVVLMVTKKGVPETHIAVDYSDLAQMNMAVDLLKIELLRMISANTETGGKRE